jgi:putative oxidoreductase
MLQMDKTEIRRSAAHLPVRAALGGSMLYHGLGKLSGEGPVKTGQLFKEIGFEKGQRWAIAAGIAEAFAGVSAILGVLTRPAAVAVLATQAVAIGKIHGKNGYDIAKGGYEYNLALMGIALLMLIDGPGTFSVHEAIERGAQGRGLKRVLNRARPSFLVRAIQALK